MNSTTNTLTIAETLEYMIEQIDRDIRSIGDPLVEAWCRFQLSDLLNGKIDNQ